MEPDHTVIHCAVSARGDGVQLSAAVLGLSARKVEAPARRFDRLFPARLNCLEGSCDGEGAGRDLNMQAADHLKSCCHDDVHAERHVITCETKGPEYREYIADVARHERRLTCLTTTNYAAVARLGRSDGNGFIAAVTRPGKNGEDVLRIVVEGVATTSHLLPRTGGAAV